MIALLSCRKLKRALAEQRFRQEGFAEQVGISDRHVRNLCKKDTDVSVSRLFSMSQVLNIPMQELLVFKNEDNE